MQTEKRTKSIPKKGKRSFEVIDYTVDEETRTLEFSFSSEKPVRRWFGMEILSHKDGCFDFSRLNNGAAPLLFNHGRDLHLGAVDAGWVKELKGYCKVRFGRSALAEEKFQDVKDKILKNVSFAYEVEDMILVQKGAEGELPVYEARDWNVYEVSFVTIPADDTVGLGRSKKDEDDETIEIEDDSVEEKSTSEDDSENAESDEKSKKDENENADDSAKERNLHMSTPAVDAAKLERERIQTITAIGEKHGQAELARQFIDNEGTVEQMREAVLEKMGARKMDINSKPGDLELTEKEKRSYSLVKALRAHTTGNWKDAGFERELSEQIAKRAGKESAGFFMPMNVTLDARAAYNTGTASQGGNLVATNLLAGSFIDILRAKTLVAKLGAQFLSGLVGNVAIPRQNGSATTYWVTEGNDVTEAEGTFDMVTMTPKTLGARSKITRQMMQQSTPDIEMLVRNDLAASIAVGIDKAAIAGSGTAGQPTGIMNMAGIGSIVKGANGGAVTIDDLIDMETAVAMANADVDGAAFAYLTNPKVVGALKKLKSTNGEYLWTGFGQGVQKGTPGEINGYPVGRTTQVPSNGTKGTSAGICSSLIFGNWSDLLIGEWGILEILPNPYGSGFNSGSLDIRALQTVDVQARHVESFAAGSDFLTT